MLQIGLIALAAMLGVLLVATRSLKLLTDPGNSLGSRVNNASKESIRAKRVRFSNVERLILITTRQEYIDHKIHSLLWYTEQDCAQFKKEARAEIALYIESKEGQERCFHPSTNRIS